MGAVLGLVEARQRFASDPCEHAIERLDDGDPLAELGQHRRSLQPDIAAADNDDPRCSTKLAADPVDIGPGTHGVDAR